MKGGCSGGVGCGRVVRSAGVLWGRISGCRGALRGEPHKWGYPGVTAYGCSSEGVWDVKEHELERCVAC